MQSNIKNRMKNFSYFSPRAVYDSFDSRWSLIPASSILNIIHHKRQRLRLLQSRTCVNDAALDDEGQEFFGWNEIFFFYSQKISTRRRVLLILWSGLPTHACRVGLQPYTRIKMGSSFNLWAVLVPSLKCVRALEQILGGGFLKFLIVSTIFKWLYLPYF